MTQTTSTGHIPEVLTEPSTGRLPGISFPPYFTDRDALESICTDFSHLPGFEWRSHIETEAAANAEYLGQSVGCSAGRGRPLLLTDIYLHMTERSAQLARDFLAWTAVHDVAAAYVRARRAAAVLTHTRLVRGGPGRALPMPDTTRAPQESPHAWRAGDPAVTLEEGLAALAVLMDGPHGTGQDAATVAGLLAHNADDASTRVAVYLAGGAHLATGMNPYDVPGAVVMGHLPPTDLTRLGAAASGIYGRILPLIPRERARGVWELLAWLGWQSSREDFAQHCNEQARRAGGPSTALGVIADAEVPPVWQFA